MTIETVKTVAKRFLANKEPGALALKGAWGVGKTYAWNQIIDASKDNIALPSYCYVSLFGITSLSELRIAIVAKTQDTKLIGRKFKAKAHFKDNLSIAGEKLKSFIPNVHALSKYLPQIDKISVGLEIFAAYMISETVICFDDFERLNDKRIKAEELLGFISSLKEEKGCKVVLIYNEDKLENHKEAYDKYREKIVDIELLYDPSAEEAVKIAFSENLPGRDIAIKYAISLQIKNIRILRKIANLIELVHKEIEDLHDNVEQQAVMTVVLLAWAYYGKDEKTPSFEYIIGWRKSFKILKRTEDAENPLHAQWNKLLDDYGITGIDDFDLAISKVVKCGYIEEAGLRAEAIKADKSFQEGELRNSFSAAWDKFRNTFSDNELELIRSLKEVFDKSIHFASIGDLDGTVMLFRNLGKNAEADELIENFILRRNGESKLFDLNNYFFPVEDSRIKERFREHLDKIKGIPSLIDTVNGLTKKNGCSKIETEILERASIDDFYNLFKLDHGRELNNVVEACLQWGGNNVQEALKRIGNESRINALRVKRFKIDVDSTEGTGSGLAL